jgi:hypothetical protein
VAIEDTPDLQRLVDGGFVVRGDDGFVQLAAKAMKQVTTARTLRDPQTITSPPVGPLEDCTDWELFLHMRSLGWSWQRLSPNVLPWRIGLPLVWYSSGFSDRSIHSEYLLCLMNLKELTARNPEIDSVPHGRAKDTYIRMLEGHAAPDALPLGDIEVEPPEVFIGDSGEANSKQETIKQV